MTTATSAAAGGQHDFPLEHLDETLRRDGAEWMAEGPRGALHLIRWFGDSGSVVAWRTAGLREVHRGTAQSIEQARAEVLRMAGLIAAGKKA